MEYVTVGIGKDLYEGVKKILRDRPELGYVSVAEFVREAIRHRFREILGEEVEGK